MQDWDCNQADHALDFQHILFPQKTDMDRAERQPRFRANVAPNQLRLNSASSLFNARKKSAKLAVFWLFWAYVTVCDKCRSGKIRAILALYRARTYRENWSSISAVSAPYTCAINQALNILTTSHDWPKTRGPLVWLNGSLDLKITIYNPIQRATLQYLEQDWPHDWTKHKMYRDLFTCASFIDQYVQERNFALKRGHMLSFEVSKIFQKVLLVLAQRPHTWIWIWIEFILASTRLYNLAPRKVFP